MDQSLVIRQVVHSHKPSGRIHFFTFRVDTVVGKVLQILLDPLHQLSLHEVRLAKFAYAGRWASRACRARRACDNCLVRRACDGRLLSVVGVVPCSRSCRGMIRGKLWRGCLVIVSELVAADL